MTNGYRQAAFRPEARVLFMSGYLNHPSLSDEERSPDDVLRKPFAAATLLARVSDVLARSGQADGSDTPAPRS